VITINTNCSKSCTTMMSGNMTNPLMHKLISQTVNINTEEMTIDSCFIGIGKDVSDIRLGDLI